jgi:DNA-binding transcriptional MerR regulator
MERIGFQIGRVSAQTGLSVDTIRFYEKEGLLERAPRTEGGFRLFSARDVQRIEFIRRAQKLGFSLPEIRELLILQHDEACCHVRDLLQSKLATVRGKLRQLRALEEQLKKSLRKCEQELKSSPAKHLGSCPVLEEIARRGVDEN